jgi:ABC-type molybdate transport system substrate-binding protein
LWHGVCFFLSIEGTGVVLRVRSGAFSLIEERNMKHKFAVKAIVAALALAGSAAGWGQTPPEIQVDRCTDPDTGIWNVDVCIGAVPTIRTALIGDTSITPASPGLISQYPDFLDLPIGRIGIIFEPSDTLAEDIATALGATPVQDSPYDLYLAADVAGPDSLTEYPQVATPVNYAEGEIMLWSNGNIDAKLPPPTFAATYTNTAICSPTMGPYGRVAQQVLASVYGIDPEPTTNPKIKTYPMINAVDNAIINGSAQSGWVPTALHCKGGNVDFTGYPKATNQVFPAYSALQAGTAIQSTRGKQSLAQGFLSWVAGAAGQIVIEKFCLDITP